MHLLLVRHCSAAGQEPEMELTEDGSRQAVELAHFLAARAVRRIISSPFRRAIDSARPLATLLDIPIEIDVRLQERRLGHVADGDWMNALRRSFDQKEVALPEGESSLIAQARGRAVVDEALDSMSATTALFSHGNLLSLIAHSFNLTVGFDYWASLSNPDVYELRRLGSSFQLNRVWR